jgi:hypothetical protein
MFSFFLSDVGAAEKLARKVRLSKEKRNGPTLLCMNRAVLCSDLQAMEDRTNLNFATVSSSAFEALLAKYVPENLRIQTFYFKTYVESAPALKQKLKRIVVAFLKKTMERNPFEAVVVANTDYWQDEVLKDVCREMAIPFIVLCRENIAVTYEQDLLRKRIVESEFIFQGTALAVASDISKDTMYSTGAYKPGTVATIGWPRFDSWLNVKPTPDEDRTLITLISYQQKTYLAPNNFISTLREFVKVARSSGKANQFCIKLKKTSHLRGLIMACPKLLFSGIKITSKQPLDSILRRSRVVIGYNTTGILEAFLTECAVIVPWWDDAVRSAHNCLIVEEVKSDRQTTYFPTSPEAFGEMLHKALNNVLSPLGSQEERLRQFQRYVRFDKNESASSRFEALIRKYIPVD